MPDAIEHRCSLRVAWSLARLAVVLAFALAVVGAGPVRASASRVPGNGSWQPGPQRYGMTTERSEVRMSDGIYLSATVTRPTDRSTGQPAAGRFPVIVAITPYGKDEPCLVDCVPPSSAGSDTAPPVDFVPYGYVHVLVDVRGTGSSGGDFQLLSPREVQDDVEIIRWAAGLPFSDGRVGMAGESYLGIDELFTAGAIGRGSPLRAIFPIDVGSDLYRDLSVPGGMFNNLFDTPYAGIEIGLDTLGPLTSGDAPQQTAANLGLHLAGNAEIDARTLTDAFDGGDRAYDQQFWTDRDMAAAIARIPRNGVAVFAYNALFDIWQRGDPLVYSILQNAAAGRGPLAPMSPQQRPDPRFQVVLGPYTHGYVPPDQKLLALEWFDTWLKGMNTGMADTPAPLHSYEIEGGRWIDTTSWPPPTARALQLYFAAGPSGSGAPSLNDGMLQASPQHAPASDRLPWNGTVNVPCSRATDQELIQGPVKEFNDQAGNRWENPCTYDDRGLELGALTYTSAPLTHPLTIAGPGDVTIYATANTANTEWVVTLNDVSPDGAARPLATGDLIGSLRASLPDRSWTLEGRLLMPWHAYTRASEQPVVSGQAERYDIELPGTLARIARGHRIRITIQSSYSPYLEPTMPDQFQLGGGTYYVRRGAASPSSVTLSAVEPGDLGTSPIEWGPCVTDCGSRDLAAEQLKSPSNHNETGRRGCVNNARFVLRDPRLRRGDHIKSVQVWIDGHRRRTVRHHGELVITLPGRPAHLTVVWHTSRGRLIAKRRTVDSCTGQHRRAAN